MYPRRCFARGRTFANRPVLAKLISCQTHFLLKCTPLRTGAEKLPGLSRDLPIVNLHKTRKTQSYQLVHIHKICKQDFALSSPPLAEFNQHKSCLRPLFHLHSHLFITVPSGNRGTLHSQIANIHSTRIEPPKKRGKVLVRKKFFHLAGSESGAMCGLCQKGRGLLIIVRIGRIWGSFGETRQVVDICRRTKMQDLVLTLGGPGQILLQMDLFSWDTDAYLVKITPKGRKTCPWRVTQGEIKSTCLLKHGLDLLGFSRCSATFASINCVKRAALALTLTPNVCNPL